MFAARHGSAQLTISVLERLKQEDLHKSETSRSKKERVEERLTCTPMSQLFTITKMLK